MNDPGLERPIADAGHDVDPQEGQMDGTDEDQESQYLDPSRWWFASTAFPLVAGTFGPIANAFNICAIAIYWREYIPKGDAEYQGSFIKDPNWLLIVNGISLAFALAANFALLFNMAGRARFEIAQSVTVLGFLGSALILIVLVSVASTSAFRLEPPEEHALTQAYYYAIWAAAIYMILAVLMTCTVYGAIKGKYEKRFNLTTSQRTLMLQTISFMVYLLVGALIYSHIEGWNYLDAVFWADFTLLTIGLGSPLVPITHAGRSLLFPFAVGGIITIGLIIGSIRSMLLESGKQKMKARTTERQRAKKVDSAKTKSLFQKEDMPERNRRHTEFQLMRDIQANVNSRSRWTSLFISSTAGCILWFIGALAFYYCEYEQGWSYFIALYFSYTTLLTIGYGDYQPISNSGKSFFVLWSLLAIPTLTVLISDMGDTVVKGIADLTNWVGSLTILPGTSGTRHGWKQSFLKVAGFGFKSKSTREEEKNTRTNNDAYQTFEQKKARHGPFNAMLHYRLEDHELIELSQLQQDLHKEPKDQDDRFYHWLLTKELNRILEDTNSAPPKTYTYDEWSYFLRLLGHDESSKEHHRKPTGQHQRTHETETRVGHITDHEGHLQAWSWLGLRSPLMSQKDEAQWLLEQFLKRMHLQMHARLVPRNRCNPTVPISLEGLRLDAGVRDEKHEVEDHLE